MPEINTITKQFSKFMINDILKIDQKETSANESEDNDEIADAENITIYRDEENDKKSYLDYDVDNNKKARQCFTNVQVEELEKLFLSTNYPDTYTRQQLASEMCVTETRIQIWFQNRRAKIRRQKKHHRRSLQGADFLYQYRNTMDHVYKAPPPPMHRYSSPPCENLYHHSLNLQHYNRIQSYQKTSPVSGMHMFEPKMINPALSRLYGSTETRVRSYTQ